MRFRFIILCLVTLFIVPPPVAWAVEPTPREQVMQRRIDSLESRLNEMEAVIRELQDRESVPSDVPDEAPLAIVPPQEGSNASRGWHEPEPLQAYFNKGLQLRSADGAFDIRVGGRIQLDTAFFDVDEGWERRAALFPDFGLGDEEDGVAFRRARLSVRGTIYENIGFKAQYDFAVNSPGNDGAQFRDVYLEFLDLPAIEKVRIGHFQEPFSLEEMTSNSYMTFMERSLANVFTPSFNTGITVEDSALGERLHWTLGLFKTTDFWPSDNDSDEAAGYGLTGRVTGVPWKSEDGRSLVHLGANFTRRNPDGLLRYSQRPESYLAERYIDTGALETRTQRNYGLEAAIVHGPLSIQGEYIVSRLETEIYGKLDFYGYYGALSWFVTGEQRPYKDGVFTRVTPNAPFRLRGSERGWGAWELALRYSHADLNDGLVRGGVESNLTLGVNWYLNANTRIMLNYIYAQPRNALYDGDLEILQTRFQVDF